MVVVLIIVETIIGTPLGDALLKASNGVLGDWASTISMIMYSMADFVIVFIMDKFVIMRHKEEKKEESEEAPADETAEVVEDAETPAEDVIDTPAEETEAPAVEEAAADQE